MILFKAINYQENNPNTMSSKIPVSRRALKDIIHDAFKHVSSGDKKQNKDCWISTTKSLESAIERLKNPRYEYNGIAVFDLPYTSCGEIYDETLREYGFFDMNRCSPNGDGVIAALDMSNKCTIGYLASILWLKGSIEPLGNFRAYAYANRSSEVLICGRDIKFTIYSKNEIHKITNSVNHSSKFAPFDLYTILMDAFMKSAPYTPYKASLPFGESDNSTECQNKVLELYKNVLFYFDENNDLQKHPTPLSFYDCLCAYIYSLYYMDKKSNKRVFVYLYRILNELYPHQHYLHPIITNEFRFYAEHTRLLSQGKFAVPMTSKIFTKIDIDEFIN